MLYLNRKRAMPRWNIIYQKKQEKENGKTEKVARDPAKLQDQENG
jgi:hypothetical protein